MVAFVAATSYDNAGTATASFTLTVPTGVKTSDHGVAVITWIQGASTDTCVYSGPGNSSSALGGGSTNTGAVYGTMLATVRRLDGHKAGDVITFTLPAARFITAGASWYSDAATGALSAGAARSGSSQIQSTPAYTQAASTSIPVLLSWERTTASGTTITSVAPSGYTTRVFREGTGNSTNSVAMLELAPQQSVASRTITYNSASANGGAMAYEMKHQAPQPTVIRSTLGLPTSTSIRASALLSATPYAGIIVSTASDLSNDPKSSPMQAVDSDGYVGGQGSPLEVTGLQPDTTYYWQMVSAQTEGGSRFAIGPITATRTAPAAGMQSFSFAAGSCAYTGSNSLVFDTIRTKTGQGGKLPLFFAHLGDIHYSHSGTSPTQIEADDPVEIANHYEAGLGASRQLALYRTIPLSHSFSDNDFAGSNSDSTATAAATVVATRRRILADPPLPGGGIYKTWVVGRIRFIQTDARSFLSAKGSNGAYLGTAQKQWFKDTLAAASEPIIFWFHDNNWAGNTTNSTALDDWRNYPAERTEIANFITANGLGPRLYFIHGDSHSLAYDTGANNPLGGFTMANVSPLDQNSSDHPAVNAYNGGKYPSSNGVPSNQYGLFTVADGGSSIDVTFIGWAVNNSDGTSTPAMSSTRTFAAAPQYTGSVALSAEGTQGRKAPVQGVVTTASGTQSTATAFGNQRKVDRTSNGVLWSNYAVTNGGAFEIRASYSTDNGATWVLGNNVLTGGTSVVPNSSLFIDVDDYAHVIYQRASDGTTWYVRGTPNAARTSYTWSTALAVNSGTPTDTGDLVVHREGTGWVVHFVYTIHSGSTTGVVWTPLTITSTGTMTLGSGVFLFGLVSGSFDPQPSIDFRHTGDGKTVQGGAPHLFASMSHNATGPGKGLRFIKGTYSNGSWTWGTQQELDASHFVNTSGSTWMNTLYDGERVHIVGNFSTSSATVEPVRYLRDLADTTTITQLTGRTSDHGSAGVRKGGSLFVAGRTGATGIQVYKLNLDGTAQSADIATFTTPTTAIPYISMRRQVETTAELVYTQGSTSPYTVRSVSAPVAADAPPAPALSGSLSAGAETTLALSGTSPSQKAGSVALSASGTQTRSAPTPPIGTPLATETWPGAANAAWPTQWLTAIAGNETQSGSGRGLQAANTGYANSGVAYLTSASSANMRVLTSFKAEVANEIYLILGLRSNSSVTGDWWPVTGYYVLVQANSSTVLVQKADGNGQGNTVATATYTSGATETSIDFSTIGNKVELYLWPTGGTKPSTPTATYTDPSPDLTVGSLYSLVVNGDSVRRSYSYGPMTVTDGQIAGPTYSGSVATSATGTLTSSGQVLGVSVFGNVALSATGTLAGAGADSQGRSGVLGLVANTSMALRAGQVIGFAGELTMATDGNLAATTVFIRSSGAVTTSATTTTVVTRSAVALRTPVRYIRLGNRGFDRFVKVPVSQTLVKRGGFYTLGEDFDQDVLGNADFVYGGGRVYQVSIQEEARLRLAGYGQYLEPIPGTIPVDEDAKTILPQSVALTVSGQLALLGTVGSAPEAGARSFTATGTLARNGVIVKLTAGGTRDLATQTTLTLTGTKA